MGKAQEGVGNWSAEVIPGWVVRVVVMLLRKFNIFYCFVYIYLYGRYIYLFAIRMDCLVIFTL